MLEVPNYNIVRTLGSGAFGTLSFQFRLRILSSASQNGKEICAKKNRESRQGYESRERNVANPQGLS